MNKIEFINDAYTKDNMRLPIVHFNSNKKIYALFLFTECVKQ